MPAASTLPTFSKTIDNAFTDTWYEIRAEAADNVLESTILWAWLKMKGCFQQQAGGDTIERTVWYNLGTTKDIGRGDVLPTGTQETHTAAFWDFRNTATNVQRDLLKDAANRGKFKIVDYVDRGIKVAMETMKQTYESKLLTAHVAAETGKSLQGLNDLVPPSGTRNTGTYGRIARPTTFTSDVPTVGNVFWTPRYKILTANPEINLVTDMDSFFNTVTNNQTPVDGLITTKTLYETYSAVGLDQIQILGDQKLLNLGFQTLKFRGADMMWTPNLTVQDILFLNSSKIEVVYDPMLWFAMTDWRDIPGQLERIAYIITRLNIVCDEPRRHGRLYTT